MTHDDRYMVTVSDDCCVIVWKVIDRDGRGKKVDRELAYSQEILIPKFDLHEKVIFVVVRPHRAIDDPLAWASVTLSVNLSVCHEGDCSFLFARWRHFDAVITSLET